MKIIKNTPQGLLINAGHREAGESTINNKSVKWDDADLIAIIPLEDQKGQVTKHKIEPSHVKRIYSILDDVCWGTLVELHFTGKYVTDVTVLHDWFSQYCEATE